MLHSTKRLYLAEGLGRFVNAYRRLNTHACNRLRLCKQKSFMSLSNLPPSEWSEGKYSRPTSPVSPTTSLLMLPASSSVGSPCKWKRVYMQAHTLWRNWDLGVYGIAPLLRGHRLPVTTIHTEGL